MKQDRLIMLLILATFVISLTSLVGSLYFSNVELYVPCDLCWYQRITIYPQVFLMGTALWNKDARVYRYSLPILIAGTLLSLYHNIQYYDANFFHKTTEVIPCGISGVSCVTQYVEYFGFISIPLLSLGAHLAMLVCMTWLWRINIKREQ